MYKNTSGPCILNAHEGAAIEIPIYIINLRVLLKLYTLFVQNAFHLYIITLFDKTGICAVQENIKIYFKLG